MCAHSLGDFIVEIEETVLGSAITPSVVTPTQYADMCRTTERSAEFRLYHAILQDAIQCLGDKDAPKGSNKYARYLEAKRWTEAVAPSYVTFEQCCEVCNINTDWLRAGLMAWDGKSKIQSRGPVRPSSAKVIPTEKQERIRQLRAQGISIPAICKQEKVSIYTIYKSLNIGSTAATQDEITTTTDFLKTTA